MFYLFLGPVLALVLFRICQNFESELKVNEYGYKKLATQPAPNPEHHLEIISENLLAVNGSNHLNVPPIYKFLRALVKVCVISRV